MVDFLVHDSQRVSYNSTPCHDLGVGRFMTSTAMFRMELIIWWRGIGWFMVDISS